MCQTVHGSEYHTEAMEERYTDTKFVFRSKLHVFTSKETIVGDVVMSQHNPFRETCCTRCILHVHHIVASYFLLGFNQFFVFDVATQEKDFGRIVHAAILFLTDVDYILHLRETFALQIAALASLEFRKHGIDHIHEIVATTVAIHDTQGMHVRVLAKVFQFGLLVVGVHRNGYGTNLGTSIKECQPIRNITRPNTYVSTSFYTDRKKTFGHIVYTFVELAPSEAEVTVRVDNVFFIRSYLSPVFEPVAEGSC